MFLVKCFDTWAKPPKYWSKTDWLARDIPMIAHGNRSNNQRLSTQKSDNIEGRQGLG